jgi:hypothetical protein
MTHTAHRLLACLRRAALAARGRALLASVALAVCGWQLAVQGHVFGHDLGEVDGTCVYALQANQVTPLTSAAPQFTPDAGCHAAPHTPLTDLTLDHAPLTERARGPPSLLA